MVAGAERELVSAHQNVGKFLGSCPVAVQLLQGTLRTDDQRVQDLVPSLQHLDAAADHRGVRFGIFRI